MSALIFTQHLPRLTMPTALLTRLRFTERLQQLTAQAKLPRLIIPVFPGQLLVGNDEFLTANGEFLTSNGEALQW